jgi:hypothetical protein
VARKTTRAKARYLGLRLDARLEERMRGRTRDLSTTCIRTGCANAFYVFNVTRKFKKYNGRGAVTNDVLSWVEGRKASWSDTYFGDLGPCGPRSSLDVLRQDNL